MMTPMRTIVDLPEEQLGALARLCQEQKISRAEAVRRAVDHLLKDSVPDQKDLGFGLWKHKRLKSRAYVDQLRSEWGAR
jgi:metal-responsive CopG/Arc/MetJ family transcriptional regulator